MRVLLIFLLLPLKLFSQDLEGVYTGTLYNDTTHRYIPYEIAISESKGKLSGYSHTIFIDENNRQETGVKSLKIKRRADKILIEDDELIYNNYTEPPPKGVRQYSTLNIMQGDSGLLLIGVFNTNRTKEYASATGSIRLQRKNKNAETKIIPKLNEMKLANSLSFIQNKPKDEVAIVPVNKIIQTSTKQEQKDVAKISLPDVKKEIPPPVKEEPNTEQALIVFKGDTVEYKAGVIKSKDIGIIEKTKKDEVKDVAIKKEKQPAQPKEKIVTVTEKIKKEPVEKPQKEVVTNIPVKVENKSHPLSKEEVVTNSEKIKNNPVEKQQKEVLTSIPVKDENKSQPKEKIITTSISPTTKKTEPNSQQKIINKETPNTLALTKKPVDSSLQKQKVTAAIIPSTKHMQSSVLTSVPSISPIELAKRKIETIRTVNFKSDSLVLTLYDNGVVDGDTVSVLLNGKNIMPHQGLSTVAINKTIYITPDLGDSLQLIMYAENLGSIPPNTGLLIIHDGEDMYQIRFAGDLQKNSAITLRRKKN